MYNVPWSINKLVYSIKRGSSHKDRYCSYMDVTGGIIPHLRIYVINGDSLRVEFTNDKNIECLDTVINTLTVQ